MTSFTKKRLEELFSRFNEQKVVVVGDLMLDRYLWGRVSRISPEAPVPVVDIESESTRFGGAANVIHNVRSLGAEVIPVGVVGDDEAGRVLRELFKEKGFGPEGILVDPTRPTTVKTRVIAHSQQVVRTDREIRDEISSETAQALLGFLKTHLDDTTALIMEDYNKGLLSSQLIKGIIRLANEKDIPVLVDPKFDNFFAFQQVTLFKPNRKEASDRLGLRIETREDVIKAGRKLVDTIQSKTVLITLGEEGMALFEGEKEPAFIPTRAQQVHDVSGAGDTVIATLGVACSAGADFSEAATIANHAAGIVCGEVGIVSVDRERLYRDLIREAEEETKGRTAGGGE